MLAPDTPQNTAARLRELGDPCTTQEHWPTAETNHTGYRKMVEDVGRYGFNTRLASRKADISNTGSYPVSEHLNSLLEEAVIIGNLVACLTCVTAMRSG
jgi:hypothetical protein